MKIKFKLISFIFAISLTTSCMGENKESKFIQVEKIERNTNLHELFDGKAKIDINPGIEIANVTDAAITRFYDIPVENLIVYSIEGDSIDMVKVQFPNNEKYVNEAISMLNKRYGKVDESEHDSGDDTRCTYYFWNSDERKYEFFVVRDNQKSIIRFYANIYFGKLMQFMQ